MQIILLSGGYGTRLWPLRNDARSKQILRVIDVDGEGLIVIDGAQRLVKRGDVINIPQGQFHALKAITALSFIEVRSGSNIIEEDIGRFPYEW